MRDYKKAVLGMTLALSMVVTGSSLDGITASAAAKSSKKATVKLSSGKLILKAGAKKTLKLKKKNVKKIKSMKWTSSKKSVAAVSKKGKITAKKAGKAVIRCKVKYIAKASKKAKTKTLKCRVVVKKNTKAAPVVTKAPQKTPVVTPTTVPTVAPTTVPTAAPTLSPTSTPVPTLAPTLAPTETPDDPAVTPAQTYATSYKGMTANNPLLANSFACDPTAIEYNGRVYVYMSNDTQEHYGQGDDGENGYGYITSMHVISSADMVNWTDHGTFSLAGGTADGLEDYSNCCWAPCATYKKVNGKDKFFIYYTNGGYQINVASADSPTGPFYDERKSSLLGPWTDNESTGDALDPAVFTDDDGSSYLVWGGDCARAEGSKKYPRIRKLADNMISFDGEEKAIEAPYFFEDSGINKIGDKYVYSYCTDWGTRTGQYKDLDICSIAYMVADSPMGPYKYVGEVLPNCGSVFKKADGSDDLANNHHSIVQFKGEYYMFYHTMVLRTSMGIHFGGRSTHVNKLNVKADGTFDIVQQDLDGVPQLADFDPYQTVSGLTSSNNAGMGAIETNVIYRKNGKVNYVNSIDGAKMHTIKDRAKYKYSWLSIKGADLGDNGPKTFQAKLKGYGLGSVNLKVCADALDGTEIVNTTVNFDKYGDAKIEVPAAAVQGKHDLYIEFDGSVLDFESWQFAK